MTKRKARYWESLIHVITEKRLNELFDDGELLNKENDAPKTRYIAKVSYRYPFLAVQNQTGIAHSKMFRKLEDAIKFLAIKN